MLILKIILKFFPQYFFEEMRRVQKGESNNYLFIRFLENRDIRVNFCDKTKRKLNFILDGKDEIYYYENTDLKIAFNNDKKNLITIKCESFYEKQVFTEIAELLYL